VPDRQNGDVESSAPVTGTIPSNLFVVAVEIKNVQGSTDRIGPPRRVTGWRAIARLRVTVAWIVVAGAMRRNCLSLLKRAFGRSELATKPDLKGNYLLVRTASLHRNAIRTDTVTGLWRLSETVSTQAGRARIAEAQRLRWLAYRERVPALCPEITGIVVGIFRDLRERDRWRLSQSSRDILRCQREDEGHGAVGTGAVLKAEAANIAALSDQVELLGHWLRHGASVCGGGDRVVFRLEGIAMTTHKRGEGSANCRS
jgi:hypothetical protein